MGWRLYIFVSLHLFSLSCCFAALEDRLKKVENKTERCQLKNIDFIYLINLDQRPEKLTSCMLQLTPYGIHPHRFPAIYGWNLPHEALNDVGLKFLPGMTFGSKAEAGVTLLPLTSAANQPLQATHLNASCYGRVCFFHRTTPGAIGCTLSHLSILQDAYESGYQTIWVMEDDIVVHQDPTSLTNFIDQLDSLVGPTGWDILYTDDEHFKLGDQIPFVWRPDTPSPSHPFLARRTSVGKEFAKIGMRYRTHSMIVRRSGMKKILDYEKSHGIFLPFDHDLAFIPDMNLYILKHNIVSHYDVISDTGSKHFE